MKLELEIHPIQAEMLKVLVFNAEAKFSQLNVKKISNDHLTFHVKRLVSLGLIEKTEEGSYKLTTLGKTFANRIDTETVKIEKQARISINIGCVRENENGEREYLIQKRNKNPYFGYHGFVGGKLRWGETVFEGAARELEEEAGLEADFKFVGIKHKMDYADNGIDILDDKFFLVITAFNVRGTLKEKYDSGENMWLTKEKFLKLDKIFDGVRDTLKMHEESKCSFHEKKYIVEGF